MINSLIINPSIMLSDDDNIKNLYYYDNIYENDTK